MDQEENGNILEPMEPNILKQSRQLTSSQQLQQPHKRHKRRHSSTTNKNQQGQNSSPNGSSPTGSTLQERLSDYLRPLLLCTAASRGDLEAVTELIEDEQVDPNCADYDNRSALHLACEGGHFEIVKYLLAHGATHDIEDKWGTTPLRSAMVNSKSDIATYLKDHGAQLQATTSNKRRRSFVSLGEMAVIKEEKVQELKNLFATIEEIEADEIDDDTVISIKSFNKSLLQRGQDRKKNILLNEQVEELLSEDGNVSFKRFSELMMAREDSLLSRSLCDRLVIPNWDAFCEQITEIFESCRPNKTGRNAEYIPELAEINPDLWALTIVTVDGQILQLGDFDKHFSIQSCVKPVQYSICAELLGHKKIHKYVGQEPSGVAFNAFTLNALGQPHNPLINSGAIMVSSMFTTIHEVMSQRFKLVTGKLTEMAGGEKIGFSNSVYLSEKSVAHRNYALAHFMKSSGGFPPGVDILEAVDFYFQMCSCEVDCLSMASIAATYANNGINPLSNKRSLSPRNVKHTLQIMYSCGMYDFSGEWACTVGLPAKSGVSGLIFMVIPDVMGIAVYSPPIDKHGNSARGVEFCSKLVDKYNWGLFDVLFAKYDNRKG